MKKIILGMFVCTLLILATVVPVTGDIETGPTSPLMVINTSVDSISPYINPTSPLTITATGPSDLDEVTLFYRWSPDNISWSDDQEFSIFEGFESGSQNTSLWNTYQTTEGSNPNARIQWNYPNAHYGVHSCAMDDYDTETGDYALNVIYTNYDFTGVENINIEFWHRSWGDESHSSPSPHYWTDWKNYDTVAFTNDGSTWYEIVSAAQLNTQYWNDYEYDISDDSDFSSPPDSNFAIAFQQYDNYQLTQDGRGWDDITIEYTTDAPSVDWSYWASTSNPDTSYPWSWDFNFPEGSAYYEFYSIGKKTGEPDETPPISADARCRYNQIPEIFDENPEDGSTNVQLVPQLDISISDAEGETMTINWYSDSEGSWEIFGTDIDVEDGTYSQTNSNFSEYETTYNWYVTVTDGVYTKSSSVWSFTTEVNLPPYTPHDPNPPNGATDVLINKILVWIGGDPNPGDSVTYDVYFGTSSPPPLEAAGVTQAAYAPSLLEVETTYYWKIIAEDSMGQTTAGPIWSFTTEQEPNDPPEPPVIYGPPTGPPGKELTWVFSSYDPDGGQLKYIIDWGDGNTFETNYYPEGKAVVASHTYEGLGDYTIIIKAEDEKGVEGPESTFKLTIERSKSVSHPLLLRLFKQFPRLERLIQLLGLYK